MTLRIGYRQDLVSMVYSRGIRDTEDLCEWVFGKLWEQETRNHFDSEP